jgi:hypothetical protein
LRARRAGGTVNAGGASQPGRALWAGVSAVPFRTLHADRDVNRVALCGALAVRFGDDLDAVRARRNRGRQERVDLGVGPGDRYQILQDRSAGTIEDDAPCGGTESSPMDGQPRAVDIGLGVDDLRRLCTNVWRERQKQDCRNGGKSHGRPSGYG